MLLVSQYRFLISCCGRFCPRVINSVIIIFAMLAPTLSVAATDTATKAELVKLKADIKKLNKWLSNASKDASAQTKKLKELELGISKTSKDAERLSKQIDSLESERSDLGYRQSELQRDIRGQKENITALLISAYKTGDKNRLKLLLDQDDPVFWLRMLTYSQEISQLQVDALDQYKTNLGELQSIKRLLDIKLQESQVASLKLTQEQLFLKQQQNDRAQVLSNLRGEIKSAGQKLEGMKSDRARLESLLVKVVEAIENLVPGEMSQPFSQRKGKVAWPSLKGKLIQRFGSRIGNGPLRSQGIVLNVNNKSDVKAVHHGRVVFSDWLNGFGLLLIIDHGEGYMSLYARNEVLMRSVGEWVNTGDLVARSGQSGLDEQGLYFEIRHKGKPQNPLIWLAKK